MIVSSILNYLGWAAVLLLLIPVVIIVRLLVKKSRWSIVRVTLVAVTGVAVSALWLHFAEGVIGGAELLSMGGALGGKIAEWLKRKVGGTQTAFFISTALFFFWFGFALMDAIIASARFFINKPYVKEVTVKKVVKVKLPASWARRTEPSSARCWWIRWRSWSLF